MTYDNAIAALADPSRREVFERLKSGPRAVGEIARDMPVSRPAVSQHLKVLKKAGLVLDRAEGTRRVYYIDPHGLAGLRQWLDQFWDGALMAFQAEVEKTIAYEKGKEIQGMTITVKIAPVQKTVRVPASREAAFDVFAMKMGRWWFPSHSISETKSPLKEVIIEPRVGGRWYEVGEDGSECDWGQVLIWEPPSRLVLAWQLNSQWRYDPDFVTELEIRFTPEGGGVTRVDLEHRNLDRFGDDAQSVREAIDSPEGWTGLLANFAQMASAAS
jgi:DNA-binding transcriptional ArsR family regulator/uncharacterized protein YndB with AHSA1/START domain